MTNARKVMGLGNNDGPSWHSSPLWDNLPNKPVNGCKHINTNVTANGQEGKNCGDKLPKVGG